MAQPLLSLCMIVKNEEKMLPGLLDSVDGLWDELVVADTGSDDGTVALLNTAGAVVVPHTWQDDFAAARNASLAVATGRWVLFLDADERTTPSLNEQIRDLVTDDKIGAATVVMRNELPGGQHRDANLLRLFRRDPQIRFRHRIHEDVLEDVEAFLERRQLQMRQLSGLVHHLGYVREVAADKNKKQRDQDLLRRTLAEDPHDFYCWFKLLESARFWDDRELWTQVAHEAAPILTGDLTAEQLRVLLHNPWSGELAALISQGLAGEATGSLTWLDQWRERVSAAPAWHLRRGLLLESLARNQEAAAAFAACLAGQHTGGTHSHVRALLGQCRLAAHDNDLPRALELAKDAVGRAPSDPEALLAVVTFTALTAGQQQVRRFAQQHLQAHPAAGAALAETLLEAGHAGPALELLAELAPNNPPLAMGLLTCALALGQDVDLNLDLNQDEADQAFQRWIRILWQSRRTGLMTVFAENCGSVTEVFPWLETFLAAETRRVRG